MMICTPCTDILPLSHHVAVVQAIGALAANKMDYGYACLSDANLCRSRAELAQMFLDSRHRHLLFIDSDMTFTAQDCVTLAAHDLPIVCGTYPKREPRGVFTFVPHPRPERNGTILKVWAAATGFMMIRRDVIESVIHANPQSKYNGLQSPVCHAIFDNMIEDDGTYLSTDFSFCKRARECGFNCYVDLSLQIGHVGYHTFIGNPLNIG